jgi:hypothetical protein
MNSPMQSSPAAQVWPKLGVDAERVCVSVEDDGCAIAAASQEGLGHQRSTRSPMTLATNRNRVPTTVPMMKISTRFFLLVCADGMLFPACCNARKPVTLFHNRERRHAIFSGYVA